MSIVFFHNPRCSKSRAVALLLNDISSDVETIEYLNTGFSAPQLQKLINAIDQPAHALIRHSDESFKASKFVADSMSEQQVIEFLCSHPEAFQRPVVLCNGKARIGRPPEAIQDILP